MALRNPSAMTIRPLTVSDSLDSTNSAAGVMAALQNLVPALHTQRVWVCRPASEQVTGFAGFTTPAQIEAVFTQGSRYYGLVASSRFTGKSEPFCYDSATGAFLTIQGVTSDNCPTSQPTTGDWTPPTMSLFGGRIIVTHVGFSGGTAPTLNMIGWFDLTGFLDATGKTGTIASGSNQVTHLSANVLQAGWRPGQLIQDAGNGGSLGIPTGARIVAVASDGLSLTLDQNATQDISLDRLTVAGGSRTQLLWAAGNLNGLPFIKPPIAVAQFSGRAYYAVDNSLVLSDSGDPLQCSNANGIQVLTFQDGGNVTALSGLPLNSLQGGIIQSMMAFQGAVQIQQVTGDISTLNLAVNKLNVATGTLAQNSIAITSRGMAFIAPDGLRIIDFTARVSDPIGAYGSGVSLPFRFAVNPTRMCAAFNGDVYRVSLTTPISGGAVQTQTLQSEEFWYHQTTGQWSGPHTFPASVIAADQLSLGFVLAGIGINAKLWKSDTLPGPNSSYTENGQALSWILLTSMLPDNQVMSENAMLETALMVAIKPDDSITIQFNDQYGQILDSVSVAATFFQAGVWGNFNWGAALWGDVLSRFMQYPVPWHYRFVFKQGQILLTGLSAAGVGIGNLYLKTERLGYLILQEASQPVVPIVPPAQSELLLNQGGEVLLNQGGDVLLNQ